MHLKSTAIRKDLLIKYFIKSNIFIIVAYFKILTFDDKLK